MKHTLFLFAIALFCLFTTLSVDGVAQAPVVTPEAPAEAPPLSPLAERLWESANFLNNQPGFSVDITMAFHLLEKEEKTNDMTIESTLEFSGKRNARFLVKTPAQTVELFVSEAATTIYLPGDKQFVNGSATLGPREQAITAIPSGPFRGSQMLLSDFLHATDSFKATLGQGAVEVRDTEPLENHDQIFMDGTGVSSEFWVQQGESPVLSKFSLDLTPIVAQQNPNIVSATLVYTFSNWKLAPEFPADRFVFSAPEGVTEFIPPIQERAIDPLVGTVAPNMTLPLLSGGTFNLADHKGKNIVILDFWATWCVPCRIGLPIVTRIAEKYKDKGVVLYAVNVGEAPATAQAFVEQLGLSAEVALDQARTAQKDYQVDKFPKTVIVDSDGIIREVHAGFGANFENELDVFFAELTK